MVKKRIAISILFVFLFLVIGVRALPVYGVNWDEPIHFGRGQAILHFFLTGEKDYKKYEKTPPTRQSFYQSGGYTFDYLENSFTGNAGIVIGAGHPVLSDLLASVTNRVVYGGLGLLGDIESYHLYSVFLSAVLVGCIVYFTATFYGYFPAVVAGLSLLLYPLFLGESRFNIKDPPESVYYSLTAMTFFLGIVRNNWKWIFVSSIFAGLAFGTKLNIIFLSLSLGVWLFLYWRSLLQKYTLKIFIRKHTKVIVFLILFPVVPSLLYFASWPMLWDDPMNRFLYNLSYYKKVGLAVSSNPHFSFFGINTYAAVWIFLTTPLVTLFLAIVGIYLTFLRGFKEKYKVSFFVLLWFVIPILRVMLPGTEIYGGVRQIMEFIPPFAILAGIGANYLVQNLKFPAKGWSSFGGKIFNFKLKLLPFIFKLLIILFFIPITLTIISLHPNESIYFNSLFGGLQGAKEKNIPGWGNSLGSTYRQGVAWLNKNAEKNARLATAYELRSNISLADLRSDISLDNQSRSNLRREGEYVIGVTHYGTLADSFHRKYLDRFLIPVYELKVDGVPILKIWKNDLSHTKPDYQKEQREIGDISVEKEEKVLRVDMKRKRLLTKIILYYDQKDCTPPTDVYFEHSMRGDEWKREAADLLTSQASTWFSNKPEESRLQFSFAAESVRFVQIVINDKNSCLLVSPVTVEVFHI